MAEVLQIRDKLQWVQLSDSNVDLSYFPNFLIVGPQRTATTWLHSNLRYHPDVFIANEKELYYFSDLKRMGKDAQYPLYDRPGAPDRFYDGSLICRAKMVYRFFRNGRAKIPMPNDPMHRSRELAWYLQFFHDTPISYLRKTLYCAWKYGRRYQPRVRGEATASYAAMDSDLIREVVTLNPRVKIIFMIRHPVDRAWSHAKHGLLRGGKSLSEVPEERFIEFFQDEYQLACGRYTAAIDRWSAELQPGHLFVAVHDDVKNAPEELLCRVMDFLGVRQDAKFFPQSRRIVNPTASDRIPESLEKALRELFEDEIEQLRVRYRVDWE